MKTFIRVALVSSALLLSSTSAYAGGKKSFCPVVFPGTHWVVYYLPC